MAVTVNATATADVSVASVLTATNSNLTIVSGATALLAWVEFGSVNGIPSAITVTWNGVAMTLLASVQNSFNNFVLCQLYGLLAPATGNQSLIANWTTSSSITIDAIAFNGTATDTLANAFQNANTNNGGGGTSATVTGTSSVGNINVCGVCSIDDVTALAATSSTTVFTDNNHIGTQGATAPGASSVAWSATVVSTFGWGICCIDVAAPAAATPFGWKAPVVSMFRR